MPQPLPRFAASIIRARLSTCARGGTWWFCARFPKCTGWPERGSGAAIASREVDTAHVARQRAMYCVSSLAQAGALAALDDIAHISARRSRTIHAQSEHDSSMPSHVVGYPVTPTWARIFCIATSVGMRAVRSSLNWLLELRFAHLISGALHKPFALRLALPGRMTQC